LKKIIKDLELFKKEGNDIYEGYFSSGSIT
jgi:hypothetical protein